MPRAWQPACALVVVLASLSAAPRAHAQETGSSFGGGDFEEPHEEEHEPAFHEPRSPSPRPSAWRDEPRATRPLPGGPAFPAAPEHDDTGGEAFSDPWDWPDGGVTYDDPMRVVARHGRHRPSAAERRFLAEAQGWPPLYVVVLPWAAGAAGLLLPAAALWLRRRSRR